MEDNIRRAKKFLESKGYKVEKKLVFRGLDESDVIPLDEFIRINENAYSWEESLEEILLESDLQGAQTDEYSVGDIIMPKQVYSHSSDSYVDPHRVMIIQSKDTDEEGIVNYRGFLLSSQVRNSNKYSKRYPNNIYIKDYATILRRGKQVSKEVFIRVDDIVEFTNRDLDISGVWKGKASDSFFEFVNDCYINYKEGKDNSQIYWEK